MKTITEEQMIALVKQTGHGIKALAATLNAFPDPDTWTHEQKAQAVQFAALLHTAQDMIAVKNIIAINYDAEKKTFLDNIGHSNSGYTKRSYSNALRKLEEWAVTHEIELLKLSPMQADDFIYSLKAQALSAAAIRNTVTAASSFYTFLTRRHSALINPFRGTKARPPKKASKPLEVPTLKEVNLILKELPLLEAAAVSIMAYRGLRAGALPTLSITRQAYKAHSKGKDIKGTLPPAVVKAIKAAGLDPKKPFAGVLANTLEHAIKYYIKKLFKAGKIQAAYSCHDFRHFFAVQEYTKDKDIYRVSKLLDHASIQVTENYLKSIGIEL